MSDVRCLLLLLLVTVILGGIVGQVEVSNCSVDIGRDWTVRGSCLFRMVENLNLNNINCTWYRQHNQVIATYLTPGMIREQQITNGSGSYTVGNCSFAVSVSLQLTGTHIYYVAFGPGSVQKEAGRIEIKQPGKPESSCAERTIFYEGQDRTCECTNSRTQPGNPLPTVGWRGLPPGQPLSLRYIQRQPVESQWTCEMRWGPEGNNLVKTTIIILVIVYGPDLARITEDGSLLTESEDLYDGQTATWQCQAVSASLSVQYEWTGVDCDDGRQNQSSCSFTVGREDDGNIVTCTAHNSRFPTVLYANAPILLNVMYPPTTPPEITGFTEGAELSEGDNLTLTCTVRGGNPPVSSVHFICGSDHVDNPNDTVMNSTTRGQSSVSSVVRIDGLRAERDDGTKCVCGADWPFGPATLNYSFTSAVGLRVSASRGTVNVPNSTPNTTLETLAFADRKEDGKQINVGAVVGGIIAAVVVIVAVVVVIILVRRYMGRSIYAKPGPRIQESNYTDLILREAVAESNPAAVYENEAATTPEYENTCKQQTSADDAHYQNTSASLEERDHNDYQNSAVFSTTGSVPLYHNTNTDTAPHTLSEGTYEDTSCL